MAGKVRTVTRCIPIEFGDGVVGDIVVEISEQCATCRRIRGA